MISATQEQLYAIAFRAIEAQEAKNDASYAKHIYHSAWQCYEVGEENFEIGKPYYVHPEERISSHHPDFDAAKEDTKQWYVAYKNAKRAEYNAKRRLETAIRAIS